MKRFKHSHIEDAPLPNPPYRIWKGEPIFAPPCERKNLRWGSREVKTSKANFCRSLMRFALYLGLWLCACTHVFSQIARPEITKELNKQPISTETKQAIKSAPPLKKYPNQSTLSLRYIERYEVRADGTLVSFYHELIQIRQEGGKEEAGEHEITYNSQRERVRLLLARTILPGGKVVHVSPKRIFDRVSENTDPSYPIYRTIDFSFPEMKVGACIEYAYEVIEFKPLMPGFLSTSYTLGGMTPYLYEAMEIIVPRGYPLTIRTHNGAKVPPARPLHGNRVLYRWESKQLEEVEEEPYMPYYRDIFPWVEICKRMRWEEMHEWLRKRIMPAVKLPDEGKKVVSELVQDTPDPRTRLKKIFEWFQENMRPIGEDLEEYKPIALSQVLRRRQGNELDLAALFCAMLREASLPAEIALVSYAREDEDKSVRDELPDFNLFDSAVVRVNLNGEPLWIDPTWQEASLRESSVHLEECDALLLSETMQWVAFSKESPDEPRSEPISYIHVSADGSAEIDYRRIDYKAEAILQRSSRRHVTPNEQEEQIRDFIKSYSAEAGLIEENYTDWRERDKPFETHIKFRAPNWALKVSNILLIYPGLDQSLSRTSSNPFTKPKRRFPIEFSEGRITVDTITLELPDGFDILDMPKSVHIDNDFLTYQLTVEVNERTIKVERRWRYKKAVIPASRYQEIKTFFDKWDEIGRQLIILREKS